MLLTLLLAWLLQAPQAPQTPPAAPPNTEIFLATLEHTAAGFNVRYAANITNRPGYDNQPSFTPDGSAILFTSVRGESKTSDIYRYDLASKTVTRVTETAESEYSPTVTPDGRQISVVRVEADNTQRLWRFTLDGKQPELVLTEIKPVGYHAWADDTTLLLFVLGPPATLRVADTRTGKAEVLATGIGRSLLRVPGRGTISFVLREPTPTEGAQPALSIQEIDPKTKQITRLVQAVAGAREADLAWMPDGRLLMAHDGALYAWRRGDREWTKVADLAALGVRSVTRMAVSPSGDRIAFVTQ